MCCKSNCFDLKKWITFENANKILKIVAQNNLTYKTCTEHIKLTDNMLSRFGLIDEIQQKITCKFVGPVVCKFFMGRCVHMTYQWLYCLLFVMNVHSCMYLCSMGSPIT